jgi:hypothetical protein
VGLSFLAIAGFSLLRRIRAAENGLANHRVLVAPTKVQPKLLSPLPSYVRAGSERRYSSNYGRLPLSFEVNHGQTDAQVRFLARGRGYVLFLTGDEAVLKLQESGVRNQESEAVPTLRSAHVSVAPTPHAGSAHAALKPGAIVEPTPTSALEDRLLAPRLNLENGLNKMENPRGRRAGPFATLRARSALRMRLEGAKPRAVVTGQEELPGKANYFIGNDPKKWRTNVPTYAQVKYRDVYPGIDLVYYGNQGGQLEYDFVVAPGADPGSILLAVDAEGQVGSKQKAVGRDQSQIESNGDLVVYKEANDEVRFHKPVAYQEQESEARSQESGGKDPQTDPQQDVANNRKSPITNRKSVEARFVLMASNQVRFAVGPYDHTRPLVIDPVLVYSTYLGGSDGDEGSAIAVDSSGNAYVTGETSSTDFPTVNPIQASNKATPASGNPTVFVTKFNSTGWALVYSTYLGGSSTDEGRGVAVDSSGNAYVTGTADSTDFPTVNALQATNHGGGDAFVAKLNATGSALVYSTYLGGTGEDSGLGIAVDSSGNAYVTGATGSTDFPTANPLQATFRGAIDAFVAKLNVAGSALVYSTFLGGTESDNAWGIAVDSSGNAYVTGFTDSEDFPTANPLQATCDACNSALTIGDAFVAKLNAAGSALVYSTYLGGQGYDSGNGIAVDSSGNAYVTGTTFSIDFPTASPLQATKLGPGDAFVAKLNAAGSALVYSTYLGGSGNDYGYGIAVDSSGNAYVTGSTSSTNFPTAYPVQSEYGGDPADAFVAQLNAAGSALVYSTYLGGQGDDSGNGIAVDSSGNAYVAGMTSSTDFPTVNPFQATNYGGLGAFVAKISAGGAGPLLSFSATSLTFGPQNIGTPSPPQTMTVTNTGKAGLTISSVTVGGTNASDFATSADTCTGATVTPNSTCTVNVTFTPTATGSRSASLIFTDNASDSPQTFALTGWGGTVVPVASVSPASLAFGNQNAGTTSASQPVTLSNTGSAALTIASIATTGYFGQTNNCGGSVAAGSSCTINVTFTPNTAGPFTGTLTISDNSNMEARSTQSVSLSGNGQSFDFTEANYLSATATVAPGQTATYTIGVVGQGGFNQTVTFGCTGAPFEATCTVSPNSLIPNANGSTTNITITVTTTAPSVSPPRSRYFLPLPPLSPGLRGLLMLALALAAMAWAAWRRNQRGASRWRPAIAPLALGLLLALMLAGCGGGGGGTHNPGTPASTYTLRLTGSAGSGSSFLGGFLLLTLNVT